MTAAITIHFRKAELTQACVESLLTDGWSPVLVWDNSADEGQSIEPLRHHFADDSRVWMVVSRTNLGFGKGMNAALAELGRRGYKGPVLLINNDALVLPGMQPALLAALPAADMTALVAPRLMQDGHEQGWLHYQPWLALVTHRTVPGSFSYLSGCCLLLQRPDNAAPLFDEGFFMYGEDVELSWRMRRQGACLRLLDKAYICHAGSASSGQASKSYERFLVESHWLLAGKLATNSFERLLMRALRMPSLFARACVRSWRYQSWVPIKTLLLG